jgi:hypothetical protein
VVAFVVAVSLTLVLLGVALGWLLRGPARWCPRDGEPLRCLVCHPVGAATGRASVRLAGPIAATDDRPLMTPGQINRAPRIQRRSI